MFVMRIFIDSKLNNKIENKKNIMQIKFFLFIFTKQIRHT